MHLIWVEWLHPQLSEKEKKSARKVLFMRRPADWSTARQEIDLSDWTPLMQLVLRKDLLEHTTAVSVTFNF